MSKRSPFTTSHLLSRIIQVPRSWHSYIPRKGLQQARQQERQVELYQQALAIQREINDKPAQLITLRLLSNAYTLKAGNLFVGNCMLRQK
jgi:hypothetical protein